MANDDIEVATAHGQGCECGCGGIESSEVLDPRDGIIVRSKPGILKGNIINAFNEGGVRVYELDDFTLVKPVLVFGTNAAVTEVGNTVANVLFTGTINQGSYPIASRDLSPAESVNLNVNPFTFSKTNVKRTTPGFGQSHTLTVEDDQGNVSIIITGVVFKYAFFRGFNSLAVLDQATVKALTKTLVDSILDSYEGEHDYVVPASPAGPKYIHWYGPVGTPTIQGAVLNALPVPLVDNPNIIITNPYDGTVLIEYWSKRTAVRFDPGTYPITLS